MAVFLQARYVVCDASRFVEEGGVLIEDGQVVAVGRAEELLRRLPQGCERYNFGKAIIAPALANAHTHAAMTLLRGYADDMELHTWLTKYIWPVEALLTGEHIYWGSLLACVEMARTGTAAFCDMYFFMDEVARAVKEVGLRALLSRGLIGTADKEYDALREGVDFCAKWHGGAGGRIRCALGPHAPYTCSPDYLAKVAEEADKLGVQLVIHVAETVKEPQLIKKQFGKDVDEGVFAYLDHIGFLSERVVAAHGVWLTRKDLDVLKERRCWLVHCPISNLKLASGVAPLPRLLKEGVRVALGTDGPASNNTLNMFLEMRVAAVLHKGVNLDPVAATAEQVFDLATRQSMRALGFENSGVIAEGASADIMVVDLQVPWTRPIFSPYSHLVYATTGAEVRALMVAGEWVVQDFRIVTVEEADVMKRAERMAYELVAKVRECRGK